MLINKDASVCLDCLSKSLFCCQLNLWTFWASFVGMLFAFFLCSEVSLLRTFGVIKYLVYLDHVKIVN